MPKYDVTVILKSTHIYDAKDEADLEAQIDKEGIRFKEVREERVIKVIRKKKESK